MATGLYASGVVLNPHIQSGEVLRVGTLTRAVTYVTIGGLIGWFAGRNRTMLAELRVLAERDSLTGLPNTRAFEAAITRRLAAGHRFVLLLADMDALKDFNRDEGFTAGNDALRRLADQLARSFGPDDDVARVGSDEFAILASSPGRGRRGADRGASRAGTGRRPDEGDARLGRIPARGRQRPRSLSRRERAALRAQGDAELPAAGARARRGRELDQRQLGVGLLDDGWVVRGADDCDSSFARDAREELADRERVRVVEACGGLVGEQEIGLGCQRPGDRDALLFAGREPRDTLVQQLLEADDGERLLRLAVAAVQAAQAKEQLDVLADAQERNERRLLGDEREPVPAERCAVGPVELVDALAEHDDLAGARQVEAREHVQQRRLARAGRAR